jgi:MFS transporter, NNP family, nitrate/nitrite transporter
MSQTAVARTRPAPRRSGPAGRGRIGSRWIDDYDPEDAAFWESAAGRPVARRNLAWSILAENLGFSVWQMFSIATAVLASIGYGFTGDQLFWLVATAGLVGAVVRVPYTFLPALLGGRNWTVVSTLLLFVPIGLLVVAATTDRPYWFWVLTAAACGLGGGNFASSMANISFFYPDREKGLALGLNAAGGNIGVAITQLVGPVVVASTALAVVGGPTGATGAGEERWVQNVALVWVPFVAIAVVGAWFGMDNLSGVRAAVPDQAAVARRRQTWILALLYVGTFGSFIGFSGAFPLVLVNEFAADAYRYAFLGPLVGSLSRPFGGWLADRLGGARITVAALAGQAAAVCGALVCLRADSFPGFLTSFLVLFAIAGVANGSAYRMIPIVYRAEAEAAAPARGETPAETRFRARRDAAAAVGLVSAVGALGAVFVPRAVAESYGATGGVAGALLACCGFYVLCMVVTWYCYLRPGTAMARAGV